MPDRRSLDFDRLDQIMPDVERLLNGHATAGSWTLGQVFEHLARSISLTVRGARPDTDPSPATPEQELACREFFETRTIPRGREIPNRLIEPDPDADPVAAASSLRKSLDRLAAHEGPFPSHPRLGPLSRDEWRQFHCIHCAHHLSFALPA